VAENRPLTTEDPQIRRTTYRISTPVASLRSNRDEVMTVVSKRRAASLVDVRSVDEFTGRIVAPPGLSENAQRGGHIPGAVNIPWAQAANEDGTFKTADELKQLYETNGIHPQDEIITYCRIGERSAHTWVALKYLLGYDNVKNYDGSWTEWGNLVGAPIEK
jgi:thiosulfate/3-mercaptopyruvate sulfurtransferase